MRAVVALVLLASCAKTSPIAAPPSSHATAPAPSIAAALEASVDLDGVPIGTTDAPASVVIVLASWCHHCRDELVVFDAVRRHHPRVRFLGVNYKAHETYDQRGNAESVRALADEHPWLRVIPAGDALFTTLGRPPLVPTVFVLDRGGAIIARFDRRERRPPNEDELAALLRGLAAP